MAKLLLVAVLGVAVGLSLAMPPHNNGQGGGRGNGRGNGQGGGQGNGRGRPVDELLLAAFEKAKESRPGLRLGQIKNKHGKGRLVELDIMEPEPETETTDPESNGKGNAFGRTKRNAISYTNYHWPGAIIPYTLSSSFSASEIDVWNQAVATYNQYTCIDWVPMTNEAHYVDVYKGSGCWSYIGRTLSEGPGQQMSLGTGCLNYKKTPIHEMMHAAGVFHQQSRPDRDTYVTIHPENIISGYEGNFAKQDSSSVNLYSVNYSYRSVMHYGKNYFSSNGSPTITTTDPAFLDIIGTNPTMSFEDVQVLTSLYCSSQVQACSSGPSCPTGSFRGHDCTCYCRSPDVNYPVVNCADVCVEPGQACTCTARTDACIGIEHSSCSTTSNACECDAGYTNHNNECVLTTSITCNALGVDCKCTLNSAACSNFNASSECDPNTNGCVCSAGYAEKDGGCVNINSIACDEADKPCFCTSKGTGACSEVDHSSCDTTADTNSCQCDVNYYNINGNCVRAPNCTALNSPCMCSVQDNTACSTVQDSTCDTSSESCKCASTHREENGACVPAFTYTSDGSSVVPPFIVSSTSNTPFVPTSGSDNSNFGVPSNNMYLYASGTSTSNKAAIETVNMPLGGRWCVDFSMTFQNVRFRVEYSGNNGVNWGGRSIYTGGVYSSFYSSSWIFNSWSSTMKFRISATPVNSGSWSTKVDPLKVYPC